MVFIPTWQGKLRHHLSYLRIMFYHQFVIREKNKTINKIYNKQKEDTIKGDWLSLLNADFDFIKVKIDEEEIASTPKITYKKKIKDLMNKAVFEYLTNQQRNHTK